MPRSILMTGPGLRQDFPQALRIVWILSGVVSGILVLAPFVVSPPILLGLFPVCAAKAAGVSCILCGMTTAFAGIGQHDWGAASRSHAGAIPLYVLLLMNFLGVATYTMMRVIRHANP